MTKEDWLLKFVGMHLPADCPCKKSHRAANLPTLPIVPPSFNPKGARRYREALEALEEALNTEDEYAIAHAEKKVGICEAALGDPQAVADYRRKVTDYRLEKSEWRNDLCGACACSLLIEIPRGCVRCLSDVETALACLLLNEPLPGDPKV